jgi:hypothetical protein
VAEPSSSRYSRIKEVNCPEMGCAGFVAVVSLERHFYKGNAQAVMHHLFSTGIFPKLSLSWMMILTFMTMVWFNGRLPPGSSPTGML